MTSLIKKERPDKVLIGLFQHRPSDSPLYELSKEDLVGQIELLDSTVVSLKAGLEECAANGALKKMRIEVDTDFLNMRSSPDIKGSVVARIPKGEELYLIYCMESTDKLEDESGSWCKVRYENKESWVWGNYLVEIKQ